MKLFSFSFLDEQKEFSCELSIEPIIRSLVSMRSDVIRDEKKLLADKEDVIRMFERQLKRASTLDGRTRLIRAALKLSQFLPMVGDCDLFEPQLPCCIGEIAPGYIGDYLVRFGEQVSRYEELRSQVDTEFQKLHYRLSCS